MRYITSLFTIIIFCVAANVAQASEKNFYRTITGKWSGPGQIVAGKFKGTKFVCTLNGSLPKGAVGMQVEGSCRVGVFSNPIKAVIKKVGNTYSGKFLDGQKGEGMDVVGARYTQNRLVASMIRHNLDGITIVNLQDPNMMKVTISVKHNKQIIPVIGMHLKRLTDGVVTGSTQ